MVLGEHNTRTAEDCDSDGFCAPPVQVISAESVISHPQYNRRTFVNDIGLIRLRSNIDFSSESVRPVCLPTSISIQNTRITKLKVTGWGRTENGKFTVKMNF